MIAPLLTTRRRANLDAAGDMPPGVLRTGDGSHGIRAGPRNSAEAKDVAGQRACESRGEANSAETRLSGPPEPQSEMAFAVRDGYAENVGRERVLHVIRLVAPSRLLAWWLERFSW